MDWTKWSIPLGSCLFGIPIRLHLLWPVFLGIQLLAAGLQISDPWKGPSVLYWFLLLGPVLFATILIHELGHSLAARCVGGHADGILMWPLGGLALLGHNSGPKGDLWVSFAGPLTHLPMTAAWLAGLYGARVAKFGPDAGLTLVGMYPPSLDYLAVNVCNGAVLVNLVIFAFNVCLPCYPLDGGRIFIDLLLMCRVSARKAAIAACAVSTLVTAGIIIYACIPPVNAMLIMIAAFILFSVFQLANAVRTNTLRHHPMFAYTFKDGEQPPDWAAQGAMQGSSLPVVGHPVASNAAAYPSGYPLAPGAPPPPRASGNPFAVQPGAAAAVQQAAGQGAPLPWAQHAAYAPAQPPPPPAR